MEYNWLSKAFMVFGIVMGTYAGIVAKNQKGNQKKEVKNPTHLKIAGLLCFLLSAFLLFSLLFT